MCHFLCNVNKSSKDAVADPTWVLSIATRYGMFGLFGSQQYGVHGYCQQYQQYIACVAVCSVQQQYIVCVAVCSVQQQYIACVVMCVVYSNNT